VTNESEKVPFIQASEHKYQREDLIWEAVRRNELYKRDYYHLLWKKCIEIVNCEKYPIFNDLTGCNKSLSYNPDKYINETNRALESFKWQKLPYFITYFGWEMLWLFNPEIDIDEIKVAIASKLLEEKDHPYHHIYKQKRYPVIQLAVPGSELNQKKVIPKYYFIESANDHSILCIKKNILKDRLIISIDPKSDETQITAEIRKLRKSAAYKIKIKGKGGDDSMLYNPSRIDTYIRRLRLYDAVITNYRKKISNNAVSSEDGALILPK
jgi:hypothetical protein